jgi:uncharacterized cupredoxin-like copper-binding protein
MGKRFLLLVPVLFLAAASTLAIACGSGDDDDEGANAPAATATTSAQAVQEISMRMGDWYYEPKDVRVRPGTVRVRLENVGPMWQHTLNVKNLNGEGELYKGTEVQSGQSAVVEFTVTQEGTYQLLCLVRGHADRGQTGSLTVARN